MGEFSATRGEATADSEYGPLKLRLAVARHGRLVVLGCDWEDQWGIEGSCYLFVLHVSIFFPELLCILYLLSLIFYSGISFCYDDVGSSTLVLACCSVVSPL